MVRALCLGVSVTTWVTTWLVGAAVVGAGCRGRGGDGPPCSAVAARFLDIARHDLAGAKVSDATRGLVSDQLPAMRDSLEEICTEGAWSAQIRTCLVLANDHAAFETCEQQLTDEQRRDLDRGTRGITRTP